jgi:hypothetical protein
MRREPAAQLRGVALEPPDACRGLHRQIGFDGPRVVLTMALQHGHRRDFELGGLPFEVHPRPTPMLGRVAGELHAIDGEHLAPDQPLGVADRDHRSEHPRDVRAQRAHEVRDRREMRTGIAAQGNEPHMLATGPLDPAAAHAPLGVREEHHLQDHRRRIRRGACLVVPKARIKCGQIDRVIEQMIQRMLERPWQQLPREIHGQEARVGIDVLVVSHGRRGKRRRRDDALNCSATINCTMNAAAPGYTRGFSTASAGHGSRDDHVGGDVAKLILTLVGAFTFLLGGYHCNVLWERYSGGQLPSILVGGYLSNIHALATAMGTPALALQATGLLALGAFTIARGRILSEQRLKSTPLDYGLAAVQALLVFVLVSRPIEFVLPTGCPPSCRRVRCQFSKRCHHFSLNSVTLS